MVVVDLPPSHFFCCNICAVSFSRYHDRFSLGWFLTTFLWGFYFLVDILYLHRWGWTIYHCQEATVTKPLFTARLDQLWNISVLTTKGLNQGYTELFIFKEGLGRKEEFRKYLGMEAGQLQVSVSRTQFHTFYLIYSIDLPSTFWSQDFPSLPKTTSPSLFLCPCSPELQAESCSWPSEELLPWAPLDKKIPLLKHSGVLVHHSSVMLWGK